MKFFTILFILSCINFNANAQKELKSFHITSSHTSFPDTGRANGHEYNKVLYNAADHYNDSSVLIIVPPKFDSHKKVDLIFWFHGWGNNIDSAAVRYDLINQLVNSNVNALLVFAETAKDAPDSYGGKLERRNEFKELVNDVMLKLAKEKVINKNYTTGNVMLAGHSGAYRVMAYILQNGNVPVSEVILFDALYAETDKFINWIKEDTTHSFINIYTDHGGTDDESKEMINKLAAENISTYTLEESLLNPEILQQHRIIVIHSLHAHNDIIQKRDNFKFHRE
jgi:hypothetical protein